ncbi:ABC transporter substrate-binding protein [Phytomonospora sp. NPDC050363]|uniref:ABC transporter substrate-binding protein n=1 Tax=Phytomonospora sp. NPDC050363 TaxID=3155642 RepID=UPI0033F0DDCC
MKLRKLRGVLALASATALVLGTAACADSDRGESGSEDQTFVFGAPGDPKSLDPSLATDGETFRVTRQVFETLLEHEPGGTKIVPALAESYEQSPDGLQWKFKLKSGVTFHDGEAFNAAAVCKNFERWYNWSGTYQSTNFSGYWQELMGGFAKNESEDTPAANFKSCTPNGDLDVTIDVNKYSATLPGAFTHAAMALHSPKSIDAYAAEAPPTGQEGSFTYPQYSQTAGTVAGTGPFKLSNWDKGAQQVTLERFDGYYGTKAGVQKLVFQTIKDANAGRQALEAGDIDGYDLVAPADVKPLQDAGYQVPTRGVFNILYMGMQQETEPLLKKKEVREALAHAIDKQSIVDSKLPPGATAATQFMPDTVEGYNPDVPQYEYDPAKATELLKSAGAENLSIDFCYPTEVSRPYMPSPPDIFEILKANLQAVGITVNDKPMKWAPDYLDATDAGKCPLYIIGWTGDYNEAFNFIGTWFSVYDSGWGFKDEKLFADMAAVSAEPDQAKRVELYKALNAQVMELLPGVPLTSSPPSMAFAKNVKPPTTSPLTQENFAEVSFT